ncbi:hypothetical protein OEZ86_000547 [Tetradesmus obliquus]|nr:hypothetical protein OEZ86_000547 [Tetradesmus obliquus]
MAASKPTISVEVVSDIVCPWCYVGKRRLEKAMQQFEGKAQFDVHWLPYQLNPAAGSEAINKLQYYNDKFGPARTAQIIPNMQEQYVNDTDFLLAAAAASRGSPAAALEEAGPGEALVRQELGKFSGVNGVPHFVVNGRHRVGGAQSPEVFAELFEELLQQQPAAA